MSNSPPTYRPSAQPQHPAAPPGAPAPRPLHQTKIRLPRRPILFGLGIVALFVLGLVALFYLTPEQEADLHERELEALMQSPEAFESLPPYFYEASTRRATLTLVTEPAGAFVTLNAEALGPTPQHLDALQPGYYAVRLQHPDHLPLDTTLYLASGAVHQLDVTLTPLAADSAETLPEEAPVTEPRAAMSTSGRTQRRGAAPGGSSSAGSFARANPETLQRVWHTGSLSVTSEPSAARVLVDGQPRGQTPLSLGGLRPGSYAVTLTLRGRDPLTYTVQVAAGSAHLVEARFPR